MATCPSAAAKCRDARPREVQLKACHAATGLEVTVLAMNGHRIVKSPLHATPNYTPHRSHPRHRTIHGLAVHSCTLDQKHP